MKKILLLSYLFIFCDLGVKAQTYFTVDGIRYITDGETTCSVTELDNDARYSGSIVIPQTVTYNDVIYNVTGITGTAFSHCSSLNSVVIPSSVTSISARAFDSCIVLNSLSVAEGNTVYDSRNDCNAIIETASNKLVAGCLTTIIPEGVTSIGEYSFWGRRALTSIVIPEGVTSIGRSAFRHCSSLLSVELPSTITRIGGFAFDGTGKLQTMTIKAKSVPTFSSTNIDAELVFVPAVALEDYRTALSGRAANTILPIGTIMEYDVTVTAEETSSGLAMALAPFGLSEADKSLWNVFELKVSGTINSYDFMIMRNKMINLRKLDLSEATIVYNKYNHYSGYDTENNVFPAYAFYQSGLVECELPTNITDIRQYAFSACSSLTSVVIPEGVTSIGNSAFGECSSLTSVVIPEGVTSIGNSAFGECSSLSSVVIPESVTSIGNMAFYGCSLTSIKLPIRLKEIGERAFANTELTEVHLPSSIESVADGAFAYSTDGSKSLLKDIYTYVVDPLNIAQETFNTETYAEATLHIQETAFRNYYYDTQWSQFQKLVSFNEPYEYFYLGKDFTINPETPRLDGVVDEETGVVTPPDADMKPGSGLIVKGDESQDMDDVHLGSDGEDNSGSLVGEGTQDGNCNININKLHVDISVQPNRWYFFAFPFDVPLTNIAYEGNSVWRYYDGEHRANNGNGAWKNFKGETLEAWKGYIFHGSKKGTLTISFDAVKIDSEDRYVPLVKHEAANDQDAGWNFVGNPYFNYFDINDLDYDQPITVWNGTSYETYRKGDDNHVLHPFEGYFVQKPDNQDDMHFAAENRQTKIQSDAKTAALAPQRAAMRAANKERKLINLTISDGTTTDKTRVVFNERSRAAYEIACDAAKFLASGVPQLYSMNSDDVSYSINERPLGNGIVALGYVANAKGEHTISVARADVNVMLYDRVADKAHYFTNGDYTFTTDAGTFNDRFQIIKTGDNDGATAINGVCTAGDAVIDMVEGKLLISNADGLNTTVTAINGAVIGTIAGNGSLKVQPGIYVVTVGSHSQKVMVK